MTVFQKAKQINFCLLDPDGGHTTAVVWSLLDCEWEIFFKWPDRETEAGIIERKSQRGGRVVVFLKVIDSHNEQKQLWLQLRWSLDLNICCLRLVRECVGKFVVTCCGVCVCVCVCVCVAPSRIVNKVFFFFFFFLFIQSICLAFPGI